MDVTFTVSELGDEAAARQALDEGRLPEEPEYLWGSVAFVHAGQPTLVLSDDLQAVAGTLCGAVAARVRAGTPVDLSLVGSPGLWQWRADGTAAVRVQADDGQEAVYPRAALADALQACGRRLVALLEAMAALEPHRASVARRIAAKIDAAGGG